MERMPAVVVSAGHGKVLRADRSKLSDILEGKPVLVHVIENIKATDLFYPIIVVVNHLMAGDLIRILKRYGHSDLIYVVQTERRGAADAVFRAISLLKQLKATAFLSIFGELPLVAPQTLEELGQLHTLHKPDLTSLCCPFDPEHRVADLVSWYCYLIQGWDSIDGLDPCLYIYSNRKAELGDDVLGNVYVFNTDWFERVFPLIEGMDNKHDGYGQEYHLPKIVELAVKQGSNLLTVRKNELEQIMGINNLADYKAAEAAMKRLKGGCG